MDVYFLGAISLVNIMADSKSVTRFFQRKVIPQPSGSACDFVLQFNVTIENIPGKIKTAADFLSRLEMDPYEKIILNTREHIPTKLIEVNIEITGIEKEETVIFNTTEQQNATEKDLWKDKRKHEKPY